MKYLVTSPIGGFGNHVRWLLLLDNKFNCLQDDVFKNDNSPQGKSSFIMEHVYHEKRTWHNWLRIEWDFRIWVNKHIALEHEAYGVASIHHDSKFSDAIIAVHVEPEFAYKRYLKFNSGNNGRSKEETITEIEEYNSKILNNPTTTIIDAAVLYNEQLDEELYSRCIDAFSLESNFDYASEIHKQWYKLQENAEFEFVQDITNMYRKQ